MKIIKHSGDIVEFNRLKLEKSLLKSGANRDVVNTVLQKIENEIYEGISTKKIYKLAFSLLKKKSCSTAARYNLRSALELLGPAGFYFEKYIAFLFEEFQYQSVINLNLQGKCVTHEVDIVVKKNEEIKMVECKFHSNREVTSDVKVPMYILSRFNDLKQNKYVFFENNDTISSCMIVTNTRFTEDAIAFSMCSGLELLSWDYPPNNNLKDWINKARIYPITCLTTLSLGEKEELLLQDIIIVNQLINNSQSLEFIGLSNNRIKNILKEVAELC